MNSCLMLDKGARPDFEQLLKMPWLKMSNKLTESEDLLDAQIEELAVLPGDNIQQDIILDLKGDTLNYQFDEDSDSFKKIN